MAAPTPTPPRWIGVRGLAILTVASLVACGVGIIMNGGGFLLRTTLAATAIALALGAIAARQILHGPEEGPYRRPLLIGVVVGSIGGVLVFASYKVIAPHPNVSVSEVVVIGGLLGLVAGPLFALVAIPLTVAARHWRKATPHDTFERALAVYGLVLLAFGLVTAYLQAAGGERGWDGVLACSIAAVFFVAVIVRDRARRRWLEKVLAGALPGWTVTDAGEEAAGDVPPLVRATRGDKVLTYASPDAPGAGPFRGSGGATTLRVACLAPGATLRKLATRPILCGLGVVAAFAAQPPLVMLRLDAIDHSWQRLPTTPAPVPRLDASRVTHLEASQMSACARLTDGTLRCWGNGAGALLASPTVRDRPSRFPEPRPDLGPFDTLAVGDGRACVVREVGTSRALCWGRNFGSELGYMADIQKLTPIELGPAGVIELALGDRFILALTKTGEVHTWGVDASRPPTAVLYEAEVAPRVVPGLSNILHIAAGGGHACAIDRAGDVYCWGDDVYGQSTGKHVENHDHVRPRRVEGLAGRATALAITGNASWARITDARGNATWWGWGEHSVWSPDGTGSTSPSITHASSPTPIAGMESFEHVRLTYGHACGLAADGSVSCWHNDVPSTQLLPPGSALELAGDREMLCARGRTTVWCWAAY